MASFVNPYFERVKQLKRNFTSLDTKEGKENIIHIIENLQNEINNPEENTENIILKKIKKKNKQLKILRKLKKKLEVEQLWNWENEPLKNDINKILESQIEELPNKLNVLVPNIKENKKGYNVFNNETINKHESIFKHGSKVLSKFKNYNNKNYATLRPSEKMKYRNIFISILNELIYNIIYDEVSIFLESLNRNIDTIFHNKSISFKKYIHLLIYNHFLREKNKIDLIYKLNPLNESYMELRLAQKYDMYTNFIEEYLIKIFEPTHLKELIYSNDIFTHDYQSSTGYELPTPYSDTLDFRGRAYLNKFTSGAGAVTEHVNQSTQETFLNTLEYMIENYFYDNINIIDKNRSISFRTYRSGIKTSYRTKLVDNIKKYMFDYREEDLLTILRFGKIPFELENYIISIPLPFMIHSILSNQGSDVTGLTKQFFTDLTKDINNTVINEQFMVNKSILSIVKNNKIRENIKNRERSNGRRIFINNSLNENSAYRNMSFVPVIQKFLIKKMFEEPNHNKYKFKISKTKRTFNRNTKAFVEERFESNAVQTRNSDYLPVLNKMIVKKDGIIDNNFDLQILLFTIILICCCSVSRETRKRVYTYPGHREVKKFNVKILINKCSDGSLSLGYKIILAYYILTLLEEYRSSGNSYIQEEQFNEYIFYLTIFYDNKSLYNAINMKNVEALKEIYRIYNKDLNEEEGDEVNSYSMDILLNYFKSNYVPQFIETYTKEIGLINFNKLLDFYGYKNIHTFMKSHFEGELVTAEYMIRNKSVDINPLTTVKNDIYNKITNKFIGLLNNNEVKILSKFITGNLLIQPYYHFDIAIPTEGQNITSIRSATCHNTLVTSLVPLTGRALEDFNRKVGNTKDESIDGARLLINYNSHEKALYDYYIFNKDKVIEIMIQGISSYGYA